MRIAIRSKAYDGRTVILHGITLDIDRGERLAVMGPSGSGKTSFLRIAAGLDHCFEGGIAERPDAIGLQFQEPVLLPWRTVLQNVCLACRDRAAAERWLAALGLGDDMHRLPKHLSLGMARRVGLARALAVRPQLLLLDEPTAGLDSAMARQARDVIDMAVQESGAMLILATHDRAEAECLATRYLNLGPEVRKRKVA